MHMQFNRNSAVVASLVLFVALFMGAARAEPLPKGFDPEFYFNKYPDVQRVVGRNPDALANHWRVYGRNELRAPSAQGDAGQHGYAKWKAGCDAGMWGIMHVEKWGKGRTLTRTNQDCSERVYKFASAQSTMLTYPPFSAKGTDVMRAGDWLNVGEYVVSRNRRLVGVMQSDGNFCIYEGSSATERRGAAKWCLSRTSQPNGAYYAIQQADGNFCVYRGTAPNENKGGVACVFTQSQGMEQPYYYAVLQDDANFAIYRGTGLANNWGYVWDRITTAPAKPDSGLDSFWKGMKAAGSATASVLIEIDKGIQANAKK
jgi:hypothetical protein